jgi:NAD(P)-dependent dehydrogenase (short-subunit alcohol dehydrogenase family)
MPSFDPDATYLITGGVGALGRRLAHWMVQRGARHLVTTALHALPPEGDWDRCAAHADTKLRQRVAGMRSLLAQGADVTVLGADVSNAADMTAVFAEIARQGRPLRGILHLAGLPENQPIVDAQFARDRRILAPKVAGAWLLHERALEAPLDFFVSFSSISATWGSRGQPLYAAGNQFLNALAAYRRARGLPALTVSWGPWSDGGMVDATSLDVLARMGVAPLHPDEATRTLGSLFTSGLHDAVVARVDWGRFKDLSALRRRRPLFDGIAADAAPAAATQTPLARELAALSGADWHARVVDHVRGLVMAVLGWTSPAPPDIRKGLFEMGMDSLTALELKNRLQGTLGMTLGGTVLFNHPSILAVTEYLSTMIGPARTVSSPPPADAAGIPMPDAPAADLSSLSEAELARLLDEQLGALDSSPD